MIPTEVAELAQQLALAAGRAEYNDDDIAKAFAMHKVAEASWNAARAIGLADSEEDSGPWPPTAGQFGWQEDDSEACRRVELAKAGAAIDALALGGQKGVQERCQRCGGEVQGWLCQSCPAEFRENDDGHLVFDEDTTLARAEAQDEGAAGEREALALDQLANAAEVVRRLLHKTKEVQGPAFREAGISFTASIDHARAVLRQRDALLAHPSPTPAADADRVRIAVEALEPFAHIASHVGLPKDDTVHVTALDGQWIATVRREDFWNARQALAALKSEGK